MYEPTLQGIGDYDRLKGEKRRVVRAVIIAGLIVGAFFVIVEHSYLGEVHDRLPVSEGIPNVPFAH
jgi:hypothetical protein